MKKYLKSPYLYLGLIILTVFVVLACIGFVVPDKFINKEIAHQAIDMLYANTNNKEAWDLYNSQFNKKFYYMNALYGILTMCITLIVGFAIAKVKEFSDIKNIFGNFRKRFTFLYINLYYIWFCFATTHNMYASFEQDVFPTYADSFGIAIVGTAVMLVMLSIPYYLVSNLSIIFGFKTQYRNYFLISFYFVMSLLGLLYLQSNILYLKYSYVSVIDVVTTMIWIYFLVNLGYVQITTKETSPRMKSIIAKFKRTKD